MAEHGGEATIPPSGHVALEATKRIRHEVLLFGVVVAALLAGAAMFGTPVLEQLRWPLVVILGLVLITYLVLRMSRRVEATTVMRTPSAAEQATPFDKMALPVEARVAVASDIAELRRTRNLRGLEKLENGLAPHRLPNGVYGFTVPWAITGEPGHIAQFTSSLGLQRSAGGTVVMEVHKLSEDDLWVVGYVSDDARLNLQGPPAQDRELMFFPRAWGNFTNLVAIPVSRIIGASMRDVEDAYVLDLRVR